MLVHVTVLCPNIKYNISLKHISNKCLTPNFCLPLLALTSSPPALFPRKDQHGRITWLDASCTVAASPQDHTPRWVWCVRRSVGLLKGLGLLGETSRKQDITTQTIAWQNAHAPPPVDNSVE